MRKRAIAIAAVKPAPFKQAIDFMYGTPKRARFTLWFSIAILALGAGASIAASCCGCALH